MNPQWGMPPGMPAMPPADMLMQGQALQGGPPSVDAADPAAAALPPPGRDPELLRNVMVNYIPNSMGEADLRMVFSVYGPIEGVRIISSRDGHESKGYGFVLYHHSFAAAAAIRMLNGYQVAHKRLKVSYAKAGPAAELVASSGVKQRWRDEHQLFHNYWVASRPRYAHQLMRRQEGQPVQQQQQQWQPQVAPVPQDSRMPQYA